MSAEGERSSLLGGIHESGLRKKGDVALAHHVEVDRVERGHNQDAGKESVDAEPGVKETCGRTGDHAACESGYGCRERAEAADQKGRGDGGAERDRAFRRDVGELE